MVVVLVVAGIVGKIVIWGMCVQQRGYKTRAHNVFFGRVVGVTGRQMELFGVVCSTWLSYKIRAHNSFY